MVVSWEGTVEVAGMWWGVWSLCPCGGVVCSYEEVVCWTGSLDWRDGGVCR